MIVKKLRNISLYNIGQFESWLSDMAKQGYILVEINYATCSFLKTQNTDMEYRIEVSNHPMSRERIEVYRQCGWNYVCSYRDVHIFSAPAANVLVELHTDPEEQSHTLKYVSRKLRISNLILMACVALLIADLILLLRIGNTPYINLLKLGWQTCVNIFLIFILTILTLRQTHEGITIKKSLAKGKSIDHHSNWKKWTRINKAAFYFTIPFCALILVESGYQVHNIIGYLTGRNSYNLTMDTELPILRLSDIEDSSNAILKEDSNSDGYNGNNRVRIENDLLIKNHYEVTETYYMADEIWKDSKEVYTPSLNTDYYELTFPLFIDGVMKDMVYKAEDYYFNEYKAVKINYNGLDDVYYIENNPGYFILILRKDNKIFRLIYCGNQNYTKVLEAFSGYLK